MRQHRLRMVIPMEYRDSGLGPMLVDWEERINLDRMRRERVQRAKSILRQRDIDMLICCRWDNVRYLTGHRTHMWPVVWMGIAQTILTPDMEWPILYSFDTEHVKTRMPWLKDYAKHAPGAGLEDPAGARQWVEMVKSDLKRLNVTPENIAVDLYSHPLLEALRAGFPDAKFLDGHELMMRAKAIKTIDEINCLKLACMITSRGFDAAVDLIHNRAGIKECEVLAAAFKEFYDMGAEWSQCSNIVCSGPYTAPYRRLTSDRLIQPGDIVIVDIGAGWNGYFADFTRPYVAGGIEPPREVKELFMRAFDALQESIKTLRPGRTTWDVYQASLKYEAVHGGFLGHGIGVGANEPPFIAEFSKDSPVTIEPNMAFAIEPYTGKPGLAGFRLEENIVVWEDGNEIISRYPWDENLFL